jgi:hypothetical protein
VAALTLLVITRHRTHNLQKEALAMTAAELAVYLMTNCEDPNKPVLVDTGDDIFRIEHVEDESHEVFIYIGRMP